jgi:hypothetical protein
MLIVAIDAYNRFRIPFEMRSQTTWLRYWLVTLIYITVFLILFYICSVLQLTFYLSGGIDSIYGTWGSIEKLYLISAFAVVLFPKFPPLKQLDRMFRELLKRWGGIPFKLQQMVRMLGDSDYAVPRWIRKDVEERMNERGVPSSHINYQNDHSPQYVYTRLSSLIVQLEMMRRDEKFTRFLAKANDRWNEVLNLYDKISYRAVKLFNISHEFFAMSGKRTGASTDLLEMDEMYGAHRHESNPVDSSITELKSYFIEQAVQLERQLFYFISMANLYSLRRKSTRKKHLSQMGFSLMSEDSTSWIAYVIPMLFIFPVFTFLFFFIYDFYPDMVYKLMMVSMITSAYTIAVGVAVCIKTRLWFANKFYQNFKSFRAYTSLLISSSIIGLISIFFTLPAIVFFKFIMSGGDLNWVFHNIMNSTYPWLILPGVAALMTAIMIDENYLMIFRTEKPEMRRWMEALLSATSLAVAMLLVSFLLKDNAPDVPLPALVLAQGLAGFIIGFGIPHWYRYKFKRPVKVNKDFQFYYKSASELRLQAGSK